MKEKSKSINLHPRNRHGETYDFQHLATLVPDLEKFFFPKTDGQLTLDFTQTEALRLLNRALLMDWYGIKFWDIPLDYLCPPVPGRADYIHHIADLLANESKCLPNAVQAKVLDIGVGANCIFPIVGVGEYDWNFVGADLDPKAVKVASTISNMNPVLQGKIEIRLQKNPANVFEGIVKDGECFDISICNPPFYRSQEEADAKNKLKSLRLGLKNGKEIKRNFGGQNAELYCEGGEFGFISRMLRESIQFKKQISWFTTMVSNRNNIEGLERQLKANQATEIKIIPMARGQKSSRILAWKW